VIFNYVSTTAGSVTAHFPHGTEAVNLIEVIKRPNVVPKADIDCKTYSPHAENSPLLPAAPGTMILNADGTIAPSGYGQHTGATTYGSQHNPLHEKGWFGDGSYAKGKSGWWWQPNPMDERGTDFGSTSESWIKGNYHGIQQGLTKFAGGLYSLIAANDRRTMAFAYQKGSYYGTYYNNFYGEAAPYFLGSVDLTGTRTIGGQKLGDYDKPANKAGITGQWLNQVSQDGKLNASGEQYGMTIPTDQGVLWIRARIDYNDGTVGFYWRGYNDREWFVFDPATNYKKINGNIIINVTHGNMSYRKD
jgi:hypothetical protein